MTDLLTHYAEAIARLEIAAEAMGVSISDIRPDDFSERAQARWRKAVKDRIGRIINDEDPLADICAPGVVQPGMLAVIRKNRRTA